MRNDPRFSPPHHHNLELTSVISHNRYPGAKVETG